MTTDQARVVAIHTQEVAGATPRPTQSARAIAGGGLEGDMHGRRAQRPLVVAATEDLAQLGLPPGALREQITLDLPGLMQLPDGTRLRLGGAEIELTGDCAPCTHIGELHGVEDPVAYEASLQGHRGKIARVLSVQGAGQIRVGDPVQVLKPIAATGQPS